MLLIGIITGLFILVLLVVVHELGHAIAARRNGVVVEEFGIGFPPKAYAKRIKQSILGNNVLLSINWLPLGGFVKLQGEHDAANNKGDYGAATYWQKTKILLAGVVMNWVVAVLILTALALTGLPKILPDQFSVQGDTKTIAQPIQVTLVEDGSPADKAGLELGDQLLRLDGQPLPDAQALSNLTALNKGKTVEIIYSRGGEESTVDTTLRDANDDKKGYLGVASGQREMIKATWSAPIVGVGTTAQFTWVTLQGTGKVLGDAAKGFAQSLSFNKDTREKGSKELGAVSQSVAGPVGILGIIFPQAQQAGLTQLLFLTAIISLSLAVMNVLPIPALDGGRWFTMTLFKLLRKPLTKAIEERIQTAGFLVLMGLIVLVTWADGSKLFNQ